MQTVSSFVHRVDGRDGAMIKTNHRRALSFEDVEREISAFEAKYDVPTAELEKAFLVRGEVVEHPDMPHWSGLRRVHAKMAARRAQRGGVATA